jgi:hypothetical protein
MGALLPLGLTDGPGEVWQDSVVHNWTSLDVGAMVDA